MKDLDQVIEGLRAKDATAAVALADGLVQAMPQILAAYRARDFWETGRLVHEAAENELEEVAAELLAEEQEYAQGLDLAEHAEDLGEAFTSMLRGLMPARVA